MRERERLEDFRGGHVACRQCRRLLFFAPDTLGTGGGIVCCQIAYVPTQQRIDLLIYDRLQPHDLAELGTTTTIAEPPPLVIDPDEQPLPYDEDYQESTTEDEDELAEMVVTPDEARRREAERILALTRRQG